MRDWQRPAAAHQPPPPADGSGPGAPLRRPRPTSRPERSAAATSVLGAAGGAALAVTGIAVGLGALLLLRGEPAGSPAFETPSDVIAEGSSSDDPVVAEPDPVPVTPTATSTPAVPTATVTVPAPQSRPSRPVATAPAPVRPALTVLNNSRYAKLAARAAEDFRDAGWRIAETGNFRGRIVATTVYYESGQRWAAVTLARQFPEIERVLPRFDGLPGDGLTVVLTRDWAS